MSASESKSLFGSLIPVEFSLVHAVHTELHPLSGEICCALAAAHSAQPEGLNGLRTLHVGCGYGCDVRSAALHGAEAFGVDVSSEQIELARMSVCHLDAFLTLSERIRNDPVVSCVYPREIVEDVIRSLARERILLVNLGSIEAFSKSYGQCDVLDSDSRRELEQTPSDVVIGNISLHWLVKQVGVKRALECIAPTLKPDGVAVFSVPYHFVEGEDKIADERARRRCVYDSVTYRVFHEVLLRGLKLLSSDDLVGPDSFRKIDAMLIRDEECKAGSDEMAFVQSCTRFIAPVRTDPINVLRGLGLYEAVMYTQKPAVEVASVVVEALDETRRKILVDIDESAGTFVRFYVFRKRQND